MSDVPENNNNNNNDDENLGPVQLLARFRDSLEPQQREFTDEFNAMPLADRLEFVMHLTMHCKIGLDALISDMDENDNIDNNNDNNNNDDLTIPKLPPIIIPQ
jgi:hypothetical protein